MRNVPLPAFAGLGIAAGLIAVSYGHIYDVARDAGAAAWEAGIIAATVDGLIVMALATIALARRHGAKPPPIAKAALLIGVLATGAANLVHGISYGWTGVAVAIWVPVVAEVAYLLAMAALKITKASSSVAASGDHVEEDGRPAICGQDVPVAMLAVTLLAVRRPAPRDPRPVICTRVATVAGLVATMPPRPRPTLTVCGGQLIDVATVIRPLADLRPVICGHTIPAAEVAMPVDTRPVICGHQVAISDVAMPRPLADLRPQICTAPVTVAEVMAMTAVTIPVATKVAKPRPAKRDVAKKTVATAEEVAGREETILAWIAEADDPDHRMATATGDDIVHLLADRGHGTVSARTARRTLQYIRTQLTTVIT